MDKPNFDLRSLLMPAVLELWPEFISAGGHHIGLDLKAMSLYCSLCQDFVYDPDFDAKLVSFPVAIRSAYCDVMLASHHLLTLRAFIALGCVHEPILVCKFLTVELV